MSLKSPYPDISIPEVPLQRLIVRRMSQYGHRIALIDDDTQTSYTYQQLLEAAKRVASGLVKLGIKKGDIVALFSTNTAEWIIMFWSVIFTGATVTGINPTFTKLTMVDGKCVVTREGICDSKIVSRGISFLIEKVVTLRSVDSSFTRFEDLIEDNGSEWSKLEEMKFDIKEDVVVIPYSSGTTGLPKGVMLTHYNILANIQQVRSTVNPVVAGQIASGAKSVRVLVIVPLYHAIGSIRLSLMNIEEGTTLVVMHKFQPHSFLRAIEKYKITRLHLVPPLVNFMTKSPLVKDYNLSSIEVATCGAAPLSKEAELAFIEKVKVPMLKQGYGMTEVTLGASLTAYNIMKRPGSSGKLLPCTEGKIVDPDSGITLGPDQRGELWLRGPQVMKGYFKKPDITAQTIDKEKWLHTGDIAYFDKEQYIYIVDRIKELIKVKGIQVAPAELEGLLLGHPKVQDAAVVGIPDERAGELPRAYIVRKPGCDVTEEELYQFTAERTAPFKHLKGGVCFMSEIPKLPSGKILRRKLTEMAISSTKSKI